MSFNWWKPYSQKVLGKWKPFQKAHWKYYPCPGCMMHREIVGDRRGRILFLHFVDRPQKAHDLYWKTHPAEYNSLMKLVDKRKNEKQAKC
jgi:hypothetical protein